VAEDVECRHVGSVEADPSVVGIVQAVAPAGEREGDEQPESAAESNGNMDLLPTGAGMDKEVTFLQKLRFKKMQYNAIKPRYVPALIVL
jgi:hypothetical protein